MPRRAPLWSLLAALASPFSTALHLTAPHTQHNTRIQMSNNLRSKLAISRYKLDLIFVTICPRTRNPKSYRNGSGFSRHSPTDLWRTHSGTFFRNVLPLSGRALSLAGRAALRVALYSNTRIFLVLYDDTISICVYYTYIHHVRTVYVCI
jgi:hypothetical protein